MTETSFDYAAYLAGKKTIDDHSLNPRVWQAFGDWILERGRHQSPLRIIEAGAGTGTMIVRLLESGLLQRADYTAIEREPAFRQSACELIGRWCADNQWEFEAGTDKDWKLRGKGSAVDIHWHSADLLDIGDRIAPGSCDLLLAHAVVDLLPVPVFLPVMIDRLVPGGAFLFTINYAGVTRFHPGHERDAAIVDAYHADMDRRFDIPRWRASETGNRLGAWLRDNGYTILSEGKSDWLLPSAGCPRPVCNLFVANILDTMENALPAVAGMADWLAIRRRQLSGGILQFHAANRDYFGLKSGS